MSTGGQGSLLSCFDEEGNWTNNGEGMLKPLWAYGETLDNLDFRLETPAVNIILDDEGVGGVYAKSGDDLVRINAKATVLATGGFGKNPEMCAERLRVPSERVVFLGFDGQDGDGINMALTAGALPQAPSAIMYGLSKACGESWSSMLSIFTQWPPSYRYPLEIGKTLPMVNQSGKRFYNETLAEDADTARLNTAIASQSKVFTLFDEAHVEPTRARISSMSSLPSWVLGAESSDPWLKVATLFGKPIASRSLPSLWGLTRRHWLQR